MTLEKYSLGEYVEGGRVWPHVDCYGLVLEVRRDMGLQDWPDWPEARKGDGSMVRVGLQLVKSLERCEPEPGAMAVCFERRLNYHVAVVVEVNGQLEVLEVNPRRNVRLSPIRRFERKFQSVEYYR